MTKVFCVTYPKTFLIALLLIAGTLCFGVSSVQAQTPEDAGANPQLNKVLQKLDAVSCAASGYIDNLDGTVCDCVRNLMWEQKVGMVDFTVSFDCDDAKECPDPHNVNNKYNWSDSGQEPDGSAFDVFLAQLNDVDGGGTDCFAGHCDWRIPKAGNDEGEQELQSIVDLGEGFCGDLVGACINPIFGPTAPGIYSSSTEGDVMFGKVVGVDFLIGQVSGDGEKQGYHFFRAVRSCE